MEARSTAVASVKRRLIDRIIVKCMREHIPERNLTVVLNAVDNSHSVQVFGDMYYRAKILINDQLIKK